MSLLTAIEAAKLLGLSHARVRQLCESGALPATKFGKHLWSIREEDLINFKMQREKGKEK